MLGLVSTTTVLPGARGAVVVGVDSSKPDADPPVHSVVVVVVVVASDAVVAAGSAWVCLDNASACARFLLRSAFRRKMSSLRASTFQNILTIFRCYTPSIKLGPSVVSIESAFLF